MRVFLSFLLIFSSILPAAVLYVSPSRGAGGDGHQWSSAFPSLQQAIDRALPGDEIWLAGGRYVPEYQHEILGNSPLALSFCIEKNITVRGGFTGHESSPQERQLCQVNSCAWEFANPTVLCLPPNSEGQLVRIQEEVTFEADGVVFQGGIASGTALDGYGGAIQGQGRLFLKNCLFQDNHAVCGGAIAWSGDSVIESCGFFRNDVLDGGLSGGAACLQGYVFMSGVIAAANGTNAQEGGAFDLDGAGMLQNCTIAENAAQLRGGAMSLVGKFDVINCVFWNNAPRCRQITDDTGESSFYACAMDSDFHGHQLLVLQENNTGQHGVDFNDNAPHVYYPCFRNPSKADYSLAAGSYLLKRGLPRPRGHDAFGKPLAARTLPDLGACQSVLAGNLALCLRPVSRLVYGEKAFFRLEWGVMTPEGITPQLRLPSEHFTPPARASDGWLTECLKAGTLSYVIHGIPGADKAHFWNEIHVTSPLKILPRPLLLFADDIHLDEDEDAIPSWEIAAGTLSPKDKITGQPAISSPDSVTGIQLITQGSLAVQDGNQGRNYSLTFLPGKIYPSRKPLASPSTRFTSGTISHAP